ncbi:MAG TPA: hypothetical protein DCS93_02790 [Microscillaceae bacterium]|nr:hypothetical protein [Microscillaceae bacterium]
MKNYQFIFFLIFACFLSFNITYGQGFQIPNDTCPNVPITFTSPVSTANTYDWDFCTGDLALSLSTNTLLSTLNKTQANRVEGMTTVFDGTNWYGFYTNRENNTLSRLSFGTNLASTPPFPINLGNPGGLLALPRSIKIFKEGNNWYGIVLNLASRIVILDFGTSLTSTPTASLVPVYTEVTVPADVDVVRDGTNTYVIAVNYSGTASNVVILDYGSSITNPTPTITATGGLPLQEGYSVRAIKDNNQWHVFATSIVLGVTGRKPQFLVLDFGSSLHNTSPTVRDYTPTQANNDDDLNEMVPLIDGNHRFSFALTITGDLYRYSYGNSFTNTPKIDSLGNFGSIGGGGVNIGSASLTFSKQNSRWYGFTFNSNSPSPNSQLVRINFEEVGCNLSDASITGSQPTVQNTFIDANKFRVSLTTRNADGVALGYFVDSLTTDANIIPSFVVTNNCLGETVVLTNKSIGNDSDVLTWEWSFGDGSTSNNKSPTHTYTQPGKYTISLTPRTASGLCDNAFTQEVNIRTVPKASFTINGDLAANNAVTLTNTSTNFTKNVNTTFQWIVNDGVGFRYFNENPSHTFSQPGNYIIILSVTDTIGGCTSVASQEVTVGAMPEVGFRLDQQACTQNLITLIDTSKVSDAVGSKIVKYQWNFGGGVADQSLSAQPDTLPNPMVTFGFATTYEVTLTVTTNLGVSNTLKKLITFQEGITSQMLASTTSGDAPLLVNFTSQSSDAVSHLWDFGDGSTSTASNPSHTYTNPGIYTVTYKALGPNGCSIPKIQQIIASAPNDVLEIGLNDFNIVGDQLQVSVTNNGNTPVTGLSFRRIVNQTDTLNLSWTGVINSLTNETLTFDLGAGQGDITWHVCLDILTVNNTQDSKTTNNRLCKNTIDAQVSSVIVQDNQYLITVRNNAVVPLKKLTIKLDVGNNQFTETTWAGVLNPSQQTNILGTLVTDQLQGVPYFCATITQVNDTTDANTQNNLGCQDFSNDFQILTISPNPAIDFINIEYFLPQNQDQDVVQLQLINSSGKVRGRVQLLNLSPGRNTYRYSTSGIASGVYHLMFIRGNRTIVEKVVIK